MENGVLLPGIVLIVKARVGYFCDDIFSAFKIFPEIIDVIGAREHHTETGDNDPVVIEIVFGISEYLPFHGTVVFRILLHEDMIINAPETERADSRDPGFSLVHLPFRGIGYNKEGGVLQVELRGGCFKLAVWRKSFVLKRKDGLYHSRCPGASQEVPYL